MSDQQPVQRTFSHLGAFTLLSDCHKDLSLITCTAISSLQVLGGQQQSGMVSCPFCSGLCSGIFTIDFLSLLLLWQHCTFLQACRLLRYSKEFSGAAFAFYKNLLNILLLPLQNTLWSWEMWILFWTGRKWLLKFILVLAQKQGAPFAHVFKSSSVSVVFSGKTGKLEYFGDMITSFIS